jgi:hypothetical protein
MRPRMKFETMNPLSESTAVLTAVTAFSQRVPWPMKSAFIDVE